MSYQPRPGTVAARIIEHLQAQPAGEQLTAAQIAEAMGILQSNVCNNLVPCIKHGLIRRDKIGRKAIYTLGDGTPAEAGDAEDQPEDTSTQAFRASLWTDGELMIELDGVTVAVLNAEQTQQLRELLTGRAA